MGLRKLAVLATVVTSVAAGALPAEATTQASWYPVLLQLPTDHPGASGQVTGTDGKGGYAGTMRTDNTAQVLVTWQNGKPTVRGVPSGYEYVWAGEENTSGVVLGKAMDTDTGQVCGFTMDSHGFHVLTAPDGLFGPVDAVAINDRGDVLGLVDNSTVMWPASGAAPTVIPNGPQEYARDLDEDGTILFSGPQGPYLWRSGAIEKLAIPAGYGSVSANRIRDGAVVGYATATTQPGTRGFLWRTPGTPEQLPGAVMTQSINKSGLILGNRSGSDGGPERLATWQGMNPQSALAMPSGFISMYASQIGDDGAIVGYASRDDRELPVIWQRTGRER